MNQSFSPWLVCSTKKHDDMNLKISQFNSEFGVSNNKLKVYFLISAECN